MTAPRTRRQDARADLARRRNQMSRAREQRRSTDRGRLARLRARESVEATIRVRAAQAHPIWLKNRTRSAGCVSKIWSPSGIAIQGCLLRVQKCTVGRSQECYPRFRHAGCARSRRAAKRRPMSRIPDRSTRLSRFRYRQCVGPLSALLERHRRPPRGAHSRSRARCLSCAGSRCSGRYRPSGVPG